MWECVRHEWMTRHVVRHVLVTWRNVVFYVFRTCRTCRISERDVFRPSQWAPHSPCWSASCEMWLERLERQGFDNRPRAGRYQKSILWCYTWVAVDIDGYCRDTGGSLKRCEVEVAWKCSSTDGPTELSTNLPYQVGLVTLRRLHSSKLLCVSQRQTAFPAPWTVHIKWSMRRTRLRSESVPIIARLVGVFALQICNPYNTGRITGKKQMLA